ncbi:MAG: cation transporter [candidate division Zixibacteria bacterium]|nr:cation transporter [candidate division Zixibacteria bacterium]
MKEYSSINSISNRNKALKEGLKVTYVGAGANIFLVIVKLWIGTVGKSNALIADGIHSASDLFSDLIVIIGLKWGRKAPDEDHPYGHARIETLMGLTIGIFLIGTSIVIAYNAIKILINPQPSIPSIATLIAAFISILVKEVMYRYTIDVSRRIKSIVLEGNAWHHRTDALSSVAVLVGISAAYLNPDWYIADSIAALIVAGFIVKAGFSLSRATFREIVDTAPGLEILGSITEMASTVEGVRHIHDIKARYLGSEISLEMHVVVDPNITVQHGHSITETVREVLLSSQFNITRVTTHLDPGENDLYKNK